MRIRLQPLPRISVSIKLLSAVFAILLIIIATLSWLTARSARLRSQSEASQAVFALYNSYRDDVHVMERAAAALADSFANRPDVQEMTDAQNRQGLIELLTPIFDTLHTRYASTIPDKTGDFWLMNREQANEVADAAAAADSALEGLMWRTRWNLKFEEGIVRGAKNYDEVLMNLAGQNH